MEKEKINLRPNFIQGSIPTSFGNLVHLGKSIISMNQSTLIQFSVILTFIHLVLLRWCCAARTSNVWISLFQLIFAFSLCALQKNPFCPDELNLSNLDLIGTIPATIGNMKNLSKFQNSFLILENYFHYIFLFPFNTLCSCMEMPHL